MPLLLRTSALLFILGLLAGGVYGIRHACSPRKTLTIIRRAEELERLHQAALRRLEGKFQATQEWLQQRCTWEETMQRMRELDEVLEADWSGYTRTIGEITPLSGEQKHHQGILQYVKTVLRERPEELAEVLRRLEKDSQRLPSGSPIPAKQQRPLPGADAPPGG
jgi:hypothetical protein